MTDWFSGPGKDVGVHINFTSSGAKKVEQDSDNVTNKIVNDAKKQENVQGGLINRQKQLNNTYKDQISVVERLRNASNPNINITEQLIKKKQAESNAYAMSTKTIDASTGRLREMTVWQKVSVGQWKTAFPAITKVNNALNTVRWTMVNVMFGFMALAALASPFILLTKQGMEYEKQLRQIAAVSGEMYQSQQGLQALTGAVAGVAVGRPTTFTEAADAMLEFQRAGFSLTEAMRDVPSVINLSVAGFVDLTKATQIVTSVLHQFSDQGVSAAHAADVISKAAVSSATTVEEFGNALNYVGAIAAGAGISFEETASALALLANAGLRGSRSGTALRQVINKLNSVSSEGEASMKRLGLSFYDTSGQIKSLQEVFTSLQIVMADMTQEQKADFIGELFDIRSRAGVVALLRVVDESSHAIGDFASLLSESGFAARTAADIQQSSAMRMKTAWGNLLIGMQPVAMGFNELFTKIIKQVEDFSTRFLNAMRHEGIAGGMKELPIVVQLLGLVGTYKILELVGVSVFKKLVALGTVKIAVASAANTLTVSNSVLTTSMVGYNAGVKTAIAGTVGWRAALSGLRAMINPVTIAIGAVIVGVLYWNKVQRDAQRQTEEQMNILNQYATSIDILQTRENAYQENFMTNSAERVKAIRLEKLALSDEFDEITKDYQGMITYMDKRKGFSAIFMGKQRTNLLNLLDESGEDIGVSSFKDWEPGPGQQKTTSQNYLSIVLGDAENRTKIMNYLTENLNNLTEEYLQLYIDLNKEAQENVDLQERMGILMRGYVGHLIEGSAVFQKFNNSKLEGIVKESKHYDDLINKASRIAELEQLRASGIELNELQQSELNTLTRDYNNLILQVLDTSGLLTEQYKNQFEEILKSTNAYESQLDAIRNISNSIKDINDELVRSRTPEFQTLFNQFGNKGTLFGAGGEAERLLTQLESGIEDYGDNDDRNKLEEFREEVSKITSDFNAQMSKLKEVETAYYRLSRAIDLVQDAIALLEIDLRHLNEELAVIDDNIKKITSMRFAGETDLDKLISSISQDIKKAELESWGIVDVYQFIQDAVNGVDGAFDGVISSIRAVEEATISSENSFKRWRTTVQEHIRALILEGNDLATSTTGAVMAHANLLNSVEKFGDSNKKEKTDEEIMYDALNASRDYYYGGMHEQVSLAIQAQEDLAGVHTSTALEVIEALQREWSARDDVITKIREKERAIDDLRNELILEQYTLNEALKKQKEYENSINDITDEIIGEGGLVEALATATLASDDLLKSLEKFANLPMPAGSPFESDGYHYVDLDYLSGNERHTKDILNRFPGYQHQDFIMRPNSSPVSFSPDDTIVGVKDVNDLNKVSGGGELVIHTININGASTNNPRELAYQLAKEIKREMGMR